MKKNIFTLISLILQVNYGICGGPIINENDFMPNVEYDQEELKGRMDPEAFRVTQKSAMEQKYTGDFWDSYEKGNYTCVVCDEKIFDSADKYSIDAGFATFKDAEPNVAIVEHKSIYAKPYSANCHNCGAFLGDVVHLPQQAVTTSGDKPALYFINSAAMNFNPTVPSEKPFERNIPSREFVEPFRPNSDNDMSEDSIATPALSSYTPTDLDMEEMDFGSRRGMDDDDFGVQDSFGFGGGEIDDDM